MDALAPLSERLERRGRVGAAFAAYLSSRVDLLTQSAAQHLATMPAPAVATPHSAVEERFAEESGTSLGEVFHDFEVEPFESGPIFRWHRARLKGGKPVIFKSVQLETSARLEADLERGSELQSDLQSSLEHCGPSAAARAVADFKGFLLRSLDLRREAEDLIELRRQCEGMSLVTIPKVHRELSGASFLTLSDLGGSTVAERCRASAAIPEDAGSRLARRLCRAWLRLALSAATVPVNPRGCNVLLLADGKVAFCGGPFQSLSSHTCDQLRSYLAATAIEDHESLTDALLELSHPRSRRDERRLRHQLRHSAPFRDGGWDSASDSLSRALLAHWHQAAAFGFRPRRPLSAFLGGLTLLTRAASSLAPGESSFREAFQELRLYQLFAESAHPPTGDQVIRIADLPRKLDRSLTLAAGDGSRSREGRAEESAIGTWSVIVALLMALAAVVLLVHHAAGVGGVSGWIERFGAVAVLVLGGCALRLAADRS